MDTNRPQRLLIVEDDVHMAYLLGYLAEKERFTVESIADGRKAIERIDRGAAVDLVLLDVMLPYTDGFELLERLRAHEAWKLSTTALLLEELSFHTYPKARHLLVLFLVSILENFGYRQVMSVWRLHALYEWLSGARIGWGDMKRKTTWQQ